MNYCNHCGKKVSLEIPENDNRLRFVCISCEMIHYDNPKVVCGCIPVWQDQILLCKRAIDPRYGFWTLPAGFMENAETAKQAALRETWEEATANVEIQQLYCVFSLPHVDQIYMIFLSRLNDLNFKPGIESLETRLFREDEIPWNDLAFTTVRYTLEFYFTECKTGRFSMHVGDIIRLGEGFNFRTLTE